MSHPANLGNRSPADLEGINTARRAREVSFKATKDETKMIAVATLRAAALYRRSTGKTLDSLSAHMDLAACNANGCPLDFDKLMAFDDMSFAHDVFGIERHIDRETGKLTDHFRPRCAKP